MSPLTVILLLYTTHITANARACNGEIVLTKLLTRRLAALFRSLAHPSTTANQTPLFLSVGATLSPWPSPQI